MAAPIVLVGPPGAGKTTVGTLLATSLATTFRDTDTEIEEASGKTVADIFIDNGEEHFRELERTAVATGLTHHDGVLALGGGAILNGDTRKLLRQHIVVYLDVELSDATRRVGFNRDRPLLLVNPRAQLHSLMEARRPLYEEVASIIVLTSGKTPEQVVAEIIEALP
jgi:shikimate kinase